MAGVLLAALFLLPPAGWAVFAAALTGAAAWEWAGLAGRGGVTRTLYAGGLALAGLAAALALVEGALPLQASRGIYGVALLFWVLAVPLWLRAHRCRPPATLLLPVGALVLLPACLALVQLRLAHPALLLLFLAIVWLADIAAYFSGRRFGRRKLAPAISPGKTWAGVYGALAATVVYAVLWAMFLPAFLPALARASVPRMVALVVVLTVLSIVGDLCESLLKRQAGVKDSGRLLPGHGGVLDRIDALLPVLPVAALLTSS